MPGRRAEAGVLEQSTLVGRRGRRLKAAGRLLQVVVLGDLFGVPRVGRVGGELGMGKDGAAKGEVVAALQLHALGQQRGVPVLCAVPDPARAPLFEFPYDAGQLAGADEARFGAGRGRGAVRREFL